MEELKQVTQESALEEALEQAWTEEEAEERSGTGLDTAEAWEEEAGEGAPARAEGTDQSQSFTLKHLDKVHSVGKEEMVKLAQQGLDYERVRAERDRLRGYRSETGPLLEQMQADARRLGMTPEQYLELCRGGNGESGRAPEGGRPELRQARQQGDMRSFLLRYPEVTPEEIPPQVWAAVRRGEGLTEAYTLYRSSRLEADLAAERQNRSNERRSTGSLVSGDDGLHQSELDRWWNYE